MKKYSIPTIIAILGAFIFLISGFAGDLCIKGVIFSIRSMLINISATFICISILAFIYEHLGGEPIHNLIQYLIKLQHVSHSIKDLGIEEIAPTRNTFEYTRIHNDLKNSEEMFIASREFDSIRYKDVRELFKNYLIRDEASLKILIDKECERKNDLLNFYNSLPELSKNKFTIKEGDSISCCMYGSDHKIYVTPYLNILQGGESPSFLCCNNDSKSLYQIYKEEFENTWGQSVEVRPAINRDKSKRI